MTAYPIAQIVADVFTAEALKAIDIRQSKTFLELARTPKERGNLAAVVGVTSQDILQFANAADLMRIKGLGRDYIALLRAVGVFTMRDLRCRNAKNLMRSMCLANASAAIVRFLPALAFVRSWIDQARTLPLVIKYKG